MANPIRVAGVAFLQRDGLAYQLRGALRIQPLTRTKEGLAGQDGVHGYKEMPAVPYIEAEITIGSVSVKALQGISDSTVRAECANGKVYILRSAWFAGEAAYDAAEGKVTVRFEGLECLEITT